MPSQSPVSTTKSNQQQHSHLTSRRSFGSTDSNASSYDLQNYNNMSDTKTSLNAKSKGNHDNNPNNSDNSNNPNNPNNPNNTNGTLDNDKRKSWIKRNYDKYCPSLVLQNNASVARDNLANERTFLAWLRTSLSFISIGVAVTQLFRLSRSTGNDERTSQYDKGGKVLGIIFIILGIVFLGFGILRYFHSQYLMTKGFFPASRGSIIVGTILTIIALAACFVIIMIAESKP